MKIELCQRVVNKFPDDPVFFNEMITSDMSRFFLKSLPSKRNVCIWSALNTTQFEEITINIEKLSASRGFTSSMIIGMYFFESNNDIFVTVNSEH